MSSHWCQVRLIWSRTYFTLTFGTLFLFFDGIAWWTLLSWINKKLFFSSTLKIVYMFKIIHDPGPGVWRDFRTGASLPRIWKPLTVYFCALLYSPGPGKFVCKNIDTAFTFSLPRPKDTPLEADGSKSDFLS